MPAPLALAPDYASAQANLGISYYALGKYDSAAVALQTALATDPDLLHANYALGLIYNAQGREHDKALAVLQKVAAADRDDPHVRYYMGQMRAKLNEGEAAIADFKEAIRLDPYNVSAYYGLANLYRRLGREEEWKSTLEHFNQLSQAGHQGVSSSYQGAGQIRRGRGRRRWRRSESGRRGRAFCLRRGWSGDWSGTLCRFGATLTRMVGRMSWPDPRACTCTLVAQRKCSLLRRFPTALGRLGRSPATSITTEPPT